MAKIIAVANQKGGQSKTTISTTLSDALTRCGYKVLLIDTDPQASATLYYEAEMDGVATLYDVLKSECTIKEAIQKRGMSDIVAGDELLSGAAAELQSKIVYHNILQKALRPVEDEYDFIIIDTPPSLGVLLINALTAADEVIIPLKAEQFAIAGLDLLRKTISEIKEGFNPELHILGVVLVAYDARNKFDKDIKKQLPEAGKNYGFDIFESNIRVCQAVKESQKEFKSIFDFAPSCTAVQDYMEFTKEVIDKIIELEAE